MGFGVSDVTFLSRKGFVHVDLWYILWPVGGGGGGCGKEPKDCCWKRPRAQCILILCGKHVQLDVSKFGAWPHKFHWGQHQTSTKDMCMKPLVMWSTHITHPPKKTLGRNPFKVLYPPWNSPENGGCSLGNPEWGTWGAGEFQGRVGAYKVGPLFDVQGIDILFKYDSPFAPISIPSILALFPKKMVQDQRPNNTSCTRLTWLSLHLQAVLCWHFNQSLIHWVLLRRKTWLNMSKSNQWWWRHNFLQTCFVTKIFGFGFGWGGHGWGSGQACVKSSRAQELNIWLDKKLIH